MSEEREYILYDIESGYPYRVSKEVYENYMAAWNSVRPVLQNKEVGKILFFGTAGEQPNNKNFKNMWTNAEMFKTTTDGTPIETNPMFLPDCDTLGRLYFDNGNKIHTGQTLVVGKRPKKVIPWYSTQQMLARKTLYGLLIQPGNKLPPENERR